MPELITTIADDLTKEEQKEIQDTFRPLGEVMIRQYIKKDLSVSDAVQFLFRDFDILTFARDAALSKTMEVLWKLARRRTSEPASVWIVQFFPQATLNVVFNMNERTNTSDAYAELANVIDRLDLLQEKTARRIIYVVWDDKEGCWIQKRTG